MDLFEHLPTAAVCLAPDFSIIQINQLGRDLLQWPEQQPANTLFDNLVAPGDRDAFHTYFNSLESNSAKGFNSEILLPGSETAGQEQHRLSIHMKGSLSPGGNRILLLNQMFNNTTGCDCYCTFATLLDAQYQNNPGGILLVNHRQELLSCNQEFKKIWQIPTDILNSRDEETCLQSVLDKMASPDEFLRKVQELNENPTGSSTDEIELLDGRTLLRHTYPIHSDNQHLGRVWHFLDITKSKNAQAQIERQRFMQNSILEHIQDAIIAYDQNGKLTILNRASQRLLGFPLNEPWKFQADFFTIDEKTCLEKSETPIARVLTGEHLHNEPFIVHTPENKRKTVRANGLQMFDYVGNHLGAVLSLHDITDIENARKQLKYMAYHDALTMLPNRRLFHDLLEHSLKQAHRNNKLVGVLFLDLDNFKNVNDRFGHEEGDNLLISVASTLRNYLRGSDILCRWGGDEFIVGLLEAENDDGVLAVADKLCTQILASLPKFKGIPPIGVSIGVAIYPQHGLEPDLLIRNADSAMYKAKRAGKNRCILFDTTSSNQNVESASWLAI